MRDSKPIIFFRVAWMNEYKGDLKNDTPYGAGSYVEINKTGGEVVNFKPFKNKYYGYVRVQKNRNLNLQRLGGTSKDDYLDDVLIVLFSKNPDTGGQFVVGWYENARLFRKPQELNSGERHGYPWYRCIADIGQSHLILAKNRLLEVPSDGPGQMNIWYVNEYSKREEFLKEFMKFKEAPDEYRIVNPSKKSSNNKSWQQDIEKRKKVELAAMNAAVEYYENQGCDVVWVDKLNCGWDLDVTKGNRKLNVEVKGLSVNMGSIELTPNEYSKSLMHKNYRLFILEYALDLKKQNYHVCHLLSNKKYWKSHLGNTFKISIVKSARIG